MGIFDVFSGKKQRLADIWAAQQAAQAQAEVDSRIKQGRTDALSAIDAGQTSALGALASGYDQGRAQYESAKTGFQPYADAGTKALGLYSDAIGLNGADGTAHAAQTYQTSPGYQFAVDQATGAATRKASAVGMLGSGNTLSAVTTLAKNLADQDYGSWLNRVKGVEDQGYAATGAIAGLTKGIGDLNVGQGTATANLYDTDAARRAQIIGNATQQGVSSYQNTGNTLTSLGRDSMMAGQQASERSFSALMGGLNLGAGLLGSAFGGAGGASNALGSAMKGGLNWFGDTSNSWMPGNLR